MTASDPITQEVLLGRLSEIAAAMEHSLFHSGYSAILRESQDGTVGLTDAAGRPVVIAGGLQFHFAAYRRSVQSVLARYPLAMLDPEDSFVVNDPYEAGTPHVPDMVVVTPVFRDRRVVAFSVSLAHKSDLGGSVPGSSGAGSREIFHDGLRLPAVRFWTRDGFDERIEAIIRTNSRTPDSVIGDLRGQVGATRLGAEKLGELCEEYGTESVMRAMAERVRSTAERLQRAVSAWPDASFSAAGFLDHDVADKTRPVEIRVRAEKRGSLLRLDFSGTSAQRAGPINVTAPTVEAVSLLALVAATDPTIPVNAGLWEAVEFVLPPGSVVDPRFPATVNHYYPTAHVVYSCVLHALGQFDPARAVAPSGLGTGALAIGYRQPREGKDAVQYELMVTSLGGTARGDGAPIVLPINHFTPSTPVEVLETEYPIRVRRYDVWRDSAGAGLNRGGIGFVREYQLLADAMVTAKMANHRYGAWGVLEGRGPERSRVTQNPRAPGAAQWDCIESRELEAGTVLELRQSGGGGYGNPLERPPERVLEDVRDGYVSARAAAEEYGVVVSRDGAELDWTATRALRTERSAARAVNVTASPAD